MELIKTFEEACERKGLDPAVVVSDFAFFPQHHRKAMIAISKLVIINEVLNDGWKPDWGNFNDGKYYGWFRMGGSSGSGFSFYDCVHGLSTSGVGSRLCFKTRELAEYAGEQFEDLYKDFYLFKNESAG